MKQTRADAVLDAGTAAASEVPGTMLSNGHSGGEGDPMAAELGVILASVQRMHEGDFSVRLPGSWVGLPGKIADTFNDIVAANELMAHELARVGQAVGKEGRAFTVPMKRWSGRRGSSSTMTCETSSRSAVFLKGEA